MIKILDILMNIGLIKNDRELLEIVSIIINDNISLLTILTTIDEHNLDRNCLEIIKRDLEILNDILQRKLYDN